MARTAQYRAVCTFRTKHGSRMNISSDIPTALEQGFFFLDGPEERERVMKKIAEVHANLCKLEATQAA